MKKFAALWGFVVFFGLQVFAGAAVAQVQQGKEEQVAAAASEAPSLGASSTDEQSLPEAPLPAGQKIYLRKGDLKWLVPLVAAGAAGFETDTKTMTEVVSTNPSFNQTSIRISDVVRDSFLAAPPFLWVGGAVTHNDHVRETGILSSEAIVDAYVLDEIVKLTTFRERPQVDNGRGEFYIGKSGLNSSFASGHSMVSWSVAAVVAGEYPSKWAQVGIYSAATAVSVTRVLGQQHFPTDVLAGSAGGWLVGHYVFRAHHHWHGPDVSAMILRHSTAFRDWPKS